MKGDLLPSKERRHHAGRGMGGRYEGKFCPAVVSVTIARPDGNSYHLLLPCLLDEGHHRSRNARNHEVGLRPRDAYDGPEEPPTVEALHAD